MTYLKSLTLPNRLRLLQWSLPLAVAFVAIMFQLMFARSIHHFFGEDLHYVAEIAFYTLTGPPVMWLTLSIVRQWVEQKEVAEAEVVRLNADLQKLVDERTSELRDKNQALSKANHRLQELDRLKSEFVSLVSHELRAPLTNLHGALELMEIDCGAHGSTTCRPTLLMLKGQAGRLERLVEDVLTVSQIEAGRLPLKRERVDLVSITNHVVTEFALSQKRRRFRQQCDNNHLYLQADADKLAQVITNLIDNALKYSPDDGEITISVEKQGQEVITSIGDSGPGIPLDEQDRIFDKFHRLDASDSKEIYGYGLGLYFCHHLIEAMNGRIWVESDSIQGGATFRIALQCEAN